jgi:hypothetical protein
MGGPFVGQEMKMNVDARQGAAQDLPCPATI